MKTNRIRTLMAGIVLSCLMTPLTGVAHEPEDPLHPISIETIGSRLAYPTDIHAQETEQGVEIKGKLKRKGHKSIGLRGHVDVELVGVNGQVLDRKRLSISPRTGTAKHDHDRDLSISLPLPEGKDYSVRVRHSIGGDDHEQVK